MTFDKLSGFGFSYPAGAASDPSAPWNEISSEEESLRRTREEEKADLAYEDWKEKHYEERGKS